MLASTGVRRAAASKSSRVSGTPLRRDIAMRWMTALVDPPSASTVVTASAYASALRMLDGRRSAQTMSTMDRPEAAAILTCAESTAGIDAAPGNVMPSTSADDVIVEARSEEHTSELQSRPHLVC